MKQHLDHIKTKIAECIEEMKTSDPGLPQYQHALFQLSYNLGRLSELTGEGRRVYDVIKPYIACANWEAVARAVGAFVTAYTSASRVSYVIQYEESGCHTTTRLDFQAIPSLGITDDHILLDAIRDITNEWSAITHK